MSFGIAKRVVSRDLINTTWDKYRGIRPTQKLSYVVNLPIFSVDTPVWLGSSYITTEFWGSASSDFYFRPVLPPLNSDFTLAVRNIQHNDTGLGNVRYKFWESDGDQLNYPVYDGETINNDFVLEIWSTPDNIETSLLEEFTLVTSLLADPEDCCDDDNPEIPVIEVCELFDRSPDVYDPGTLFVDLIFNFDTCFTDISTDTFRRKIETDELRIIETGDYRRYA